MVRPYTGRTVAVLIKMTPDTFRRLETQRGRLSRPAYIEQLLRGRWINQLEAAP